jgi:hypothetical protein
VLSRMSMSLTDSVSMDASSGGTEAICAGDVPLIVSSRCLVAQKCDNRMRYRERIEVLGYQFNAICDMLMRGS